MEKETALWSRVDEEEKKLIEGQAKDILDRFARELEKVDVEEARVEREEDRRIEGEGKIADFDFRKIMLENAPETENECVKAEKGVWV